MAPLYETLVSESVLEMDQGLLDSMKAKIQEELKKLDEKWAHNLSICFSKFYYLIIVFRIRALDEWCFSVFVSNATSGGFAIDWILW